MAYRMLGALSGNLLQASYAPERRRYTPNRPEDHPECSPALFTDVRTVVMDLQPTIFEELETQLNRLGAIRWYVSVYVHFSKIVNEVETTKTAVFQGVSKYLYMANDMMEQFEEAMERVMELVARYISEGSGWSVDYVERVDLFMAKYQPLYGSSYIPTPKKFNNSRCGIVNIQNIDQKCFLWCVLAAIHGPDHHRNYRVTRYEPHEDTINMDGIEYPVKVQDIKKFEDNNPTFSVNVYGLENGDSDVHVLWVTDKKGRQHHINLLLLSNDAGNTHYCLVKDMSRFLSHLTKHKSRMFYCNYCLHRFWTQTLLDEHLPLCTPHGSQKTRMPSENDKIMMFKDYKLCHKVPIVIYADFESYLKPMDTCFPTKPDEPTRAHSTGTAHHVPSGYAYAVVDFQGTLLKPVKIYTGPNVIEDFLRSLMMEVAEYWPYISTVQPIIMTHQDRIDFDAATDCHLCKKTMLPLDKVQNHDHLTGKFLGAAHRACNLSYKVPQHVPVFFHNLRGYDAHHLMQGFGKYKEEKMTCIAQSSEKYMSFSLEKLRFLDSLQFLTYSLDTLVKDLAAEGPSKFKILKAGLQEMQLDQHVDLFIRKGVFPYKWMTDATKLQQNHLPPQKDFFNDLADEACTDADYQHAQRVWTTLQLQNMQQYHDLYLITDVLLLADVFESFRSTAMSYYEVDPCNVYSSPGLAWNAMMKMTGVQLELLTDINMHLFVEKGVRGGVAMIPHRLATANNPLLPETYKKDQDTSFLMYLDCNNLYGTAMSQPLPFKNFEWMSQEEIERLDVTQVEDDVETGYILEVDLHYPQHLHVDHNDYPLAPERRLVTEEMLSPYSARILKKLKMKMGKVEKLLTTLEDKERYVVHYRTLKFYLEMGMEVTTYHRGIKFQQSTWLKEFITFNTEKRQAAKNEQEKTFFKLMNNAVYGKSLENVRGRRDFKLVANEQKLIKWCSSPRLMSFFPFSKDLAGINLKKKTVMLNKPVYVGLSVLDLSKLIMYQFHYGYTVKKYGASARLCMTDTDSLFYHITTPDIYKDMLEDHQLFDTSDYPSDHPNYSLVNKKVLGKFKDELNGKPAMEIVGLRAKCYAVLVDPKAKEDKDRENPTAKGVPRAAIKYQLKHTLYKQCLMTEQQKYVRANVIRSVSHQLYTQSMAKIALSPFDDKRYVAADGINTYAYGHYRLERLKNLEELTVLFEEDENPPPPPKRRREGPPIELPLGVPSSSRV